MTLKQKGVFLARQISFEGTKFDCKEVVQQDFMEALVYDRTTQLVRTHHT